jgi:hypothetical protein
MKRPNVTGTVANIIGVVMFRYPHAVNFRGRRKGGFLILSHLLSWVLRITAVAGPALGPVGGVFRKLTGRARR